MIAGDSHYYRGLRKKLIEELRRKGITDERVLQAMYRVPRHLFLDNAFAEWAYKDVAFGIEEGQTISQPYTVAFQTSLLDIQPGDKVLEIGTGSGYQAAVLAELGARVYSIERIEKLYEQSTQRLKELGYYTIMTFLGDGFKGLPDYAPFDKILITAAAPEIPQTLIDQLKPGGYLVAPLGKGSVQKMVRLSKDEKGNIYREDFGTFRFVPMLPGVKKKAPS